MDFISWEQQSAELFADAQGYLKTLERHLVKPSRFDNALLFNISIMCFEKLYASLLSHYGTEPEHHTPWAMFKEAKVYDDGLNESMAENAKFIQKFESICTFDSKGYTTPDNEQLDRIINGLIEVRDYMKEKIISTV